MSWQMLMAPFGVIFIVLLTWLLGGLKKHPTLDQSSAQTRFSQDFPDSRIVSCDLAKTGDRALVQSADGNIGMVIAYGTRLSTRLWQRGDIETTHTEDNTLVVATQDYKAPVLRFDLSDERQAAKWQSGLTALIRKA